MFPAHAAWIGGAHPFDLHEVYLDFRSPAFVLDAAARRVELLITGDSRYRLWVNGSLAGRGPARCYPWQQSVDRLDISQVVQAGANVLAVQVYQPGYSHFAYTHRAAAGLLACVLVDDAPVLVTGSDWRTRRNPSFAALVARVSIYGSGVEDRDLRLEDDWAQPGFADGGWAAPRVVAPLGGYPWLELQERMTPLLVERELPLELVAVRRALSPLDAAVEPHLALRAAWEEGTGSEAAAEPGGGEWCAVLPGAGMGWLYDLGRAHACQIWVEVEGAAEGQVLLASYAEKLRDGELVISDPETYCRVRMTDRYRLRAGSQVAEPFTMRGGRYLLVWVTGPAGPGCRLRVHARGTAYPLAGRRPLEWPDAELAAIARLCEQTLSACLQDSFVDSAWRESSLWLGDALPQALILHTLTGDMRPLRQALLLAVQGVYPDGVLPSVLPGEIHAYAIVDYNFMWVELLAAWLDLGEDAALVVQLWPALVKMLERFAADGGDNGLIMSQGGRRLFLDWAPVSRREPSAIYNLHYLLALQVACRLAGAVGQQADGARWQARAAALQEAIRAAFYSAGRWWDDRERTTYSQLAAALALLTGSARADERQGLLDQIARRSLDPDDGYVPGSIVLASPFMHHYLLEALRRCGRSDDAVEIIRRRWGRWVAVGYPTAWENWNVDFPDGSQCHAFSAHPLYHLASILGDPSLPARP